VVVNATDSPLVRAAKLAVASRQHPSNRRVITVTVGGTAGRGRLAQGTGPVNGPNLPPAAVPATPDPAWEQRAQATAKREAEVKERMRQLAQQEQVVGAEIDEPYGGDIEEDAVEQRLSEISAQRQGQPPPPPPQ
jgi:hypothetical protein